MSRLSSRLDEAVQRVIDTPPAPIRPPAAPKGFEPGVKYDGRGRVSEVTTGPLTAELAGEEDWQAIVAGMGVVLPDGFRLVLSEAKYDPAAWHRDEPFWIDENGNQRKTPAETRPIWRYRFQVAPASLVAGSDEDLEKLFAAARKKKRAAPRPATFDKVTMVVVLGDIQAGKVDTLGGTAELLERLEHAKGEIVKRAKRIKPQQIVIADGGDAMEGFESAPGADRTNDLQLMQQMRLWRRVFWDWVSTLSALAPEVEVLSVPSNHCRVRRGKQSMSPPSDDFGIEVLSQLADIAAENPTAYGHVQFWSPAEHEEALALTLVGGLTLGLVHGHQMGRPEMAQKYLAGQALGRTPIGEAHVTVFNHFHHLWVKTFGNGRTAFGSPTMDGGSSFYTNTSGESSDPGVLSFVMDERGWRDMDVAWARSGVDFEVLT